MRKDKLIKMIILNALIILFNVVLFSNAFLRIDLSGGNAMTTALGVTSILMSAVVFFYGNYKLLNQKEKRMPSSEIKTLDDCTEAIYSNMDKRTFSQSLETVQSQIKRFKRKKDTIDEILLQKFVSSEMSYTKFRDAVANMENVLYLNIKSLLNRISAFDEEEFEQIKRSNPHPSLQSQTIKSRLGIYNEYITFVAGAVEDNEQIILKLDKLLLEISKFNSLDDGEIEDMDAMKEIDELISNVKWYR